MEKTSTARVARAPRQLDPTSFARRAKAVAVLMGAGYGYIAAGKKRAVKLTDLIVHDFADAPRVRPPDSTNPLA
jgi:hypothetical protein